MWPCGFTREVYVYIFLSEASMTLFCLLVGRYQICQPVAWYKYKFLYRYIVQNVFFTTLGSIKDLQPYVRLSIVRLSIPFRGRLTCSYPRAPMIPVQQNVQYRFFDTIPSHLSQRATCNFSNSIAFQLLKLSW